MVKRKETEAVDMELQERTFGTNHVGLTCSSTYPAIPEEDGFYRSHFPGISTITLVDLRARIDEYEGEIGVEVDLEKIKLARLAYEEVLFGLRKDLRARFEEVNILAKKRKRDPNFSGFGSLHLSGFVQPLQMLAYEVYNGVAEAFATRREDADVSLPQMCHWVTRKWHKNHASSLNDVVWDAYSEGTRPRDQQSRSLKLHVDECFRGLLELQKAYPYIFRGDVAMMDSFFPQIVQGAFIEGGPTNVQSMLVYTRGEIDDWPTISWDKAAFILVPYYFNGHWVFVRIVPKVKKLSILDSDRSVDSNGKILLDLVTPLARMMPHILMAMGVQTDTDTQWNIVRPKEFPKKSLRGECGVYAIAAATFTLA
ncbi:sentrin-specific protease 1-like [Dorcoceras hygrometricum]|uniref:Sentrin-specific protease 1-like n=1 Tax=Dorcoceras hygrometricum TaxID=472368 RepID=A0A2Z7D1C7_9LAMI|nr:sentrin-specific protease 1-like [Dorcoceras hygrometricum]